MQSKKLQDYMDLRGIKEEAEDKYEIFINESWNRARKSRASERNRNKSNR